MNINALRKLREELDKNYYKCKSWCFECCTAVPITENEIKLMTAELRRQWLEAPPNGKGDNYCEFLTTEGKCSVYNQRPIICRSFSWTKWILQNRNKKVATWHCTYWEWIEKIASTEFIRYGNEVSDNSIIIGSKAMIQEMEVFNLKNNQKCDSPILTKDPKDPEHSNTTPTNASPK